MALIHAQIRDSQSAEYLKTLALGESDHEVALPIWMAARELDPENKTILIHQVLSLHQLERDQDLVRLVLPVLAESGRSSHLINVVAASLVRLGYLREGKSLLELVLFLDPDYPNAALSLKNIRNNLSRARPAPAELSRAVSRCVESAHSYSRPSLSVCMIVKDEEEFIEGAVRSVISVAQQVVVVDTGSSDRTVELARRAGAQVEFFPWTGDFSAARNASLDAATGDWILILDADERLTAQSKTALRAVLEDYRDDELRVICVKINNYTRDGRFINDGFSGRLFRRHPVMRFEGRVHEEVARGRSDVSTDYRLDLAFDHYGADPDVMREKAKDDRNLQLLQSRLEEAPNDLLTWFYVASQHWIGGRKVEGVKAFERVVELYEMNPSSYSVAVRSVPVAYSYVGLVRGYLYEGRVPDALAATERGLARFSDNADLLFQGGLAQLAAGDTEVARDRFHLAAQNPPTGYGLIGMNDKTITAWRAPKMVADLDFQLERREAAYEGYLAILDRLPEDLDDWHVVRARLVELASSLGDVERLPSLAIAYLRLRPSQFEVSLQVAQSLASRGALQAAYELLVQVYNEFPEAQTSPLIAEVVGQIAEQAGDDQEALNWYERSVAAGNREPSFWVRLAQLFSRNGQIAAAQEAMEVAQGLLREQTQTS